ncbi:MAG: hypothetical protein ACJARD_001546 [Alphaproteobacteria bacterium]
MAKFDKVYVPKVMQLHKETFSEDKQANYQNVLALTEPISSKIFMEAMESITQEKPINSSSQMMYS